MEPLIIQKKKANFYSIFLQMKKDYTFKGITLSYIYFPILYYKSRQMRKKIIQFAIENKKPIKEVFESYDPKNFSNLNVHNWFFTPRISYNKFLFKKMKEKNQKMSNLSNNNLEKKNEQIQKSILICGILSMIIIIILVISIIIYCICKNRRESKNAKNHNIFIEEKQQKKNNTSPEKSMKNWPNMDIK